MFAYVVAVLSMVRDLKKFHPRYVQPWYVDDTGSVSHFDEI
jgi:hypothetical protein